MTNRGVFTINKHVVTKNTLTCRNILIRINESASYGVIISALEIIKSRFGIIVVASVANWVKRSYTVGIKCNGMVAPSVVFIISFAKSLVNNFCGNEKTPPRCGGGIHICAFGLDSTQI